MSPDFYLTVAVADHCVAGFAFERGGKGRHVRWRANGPNAGRCVRVGVEQHFEALFSRVATPDARPIEEEALVFGVTVNLPACFDCIDAGISSYTL